MKLAASLPLRVTLAAAAALVVALALLVIVIGAEANRALSQRTLDTLDAQLAEARAVFSADGLEALLQHLDRRVAVAPTTRYAVTASTGASRGNIAATDVAASAGRAVFPVSDSGVSRLLAGQRAIIALADGSTIMVLLAQDIEDQRRLARRIQALALLGTGLIILAAAVLGVLARRMLLARIDTITTASRTIMTGNLAGRIARDGSGDEIDTLAVNLNTMLARIEELTQSLKDVSDNIAHDLRTPLNRLRLVAEGALRDNQDAALRGDALVRIIEEADGLISTFNAMLLIARLEQGVGADTFEPVDVRRIAEDTAELYTPVAEEKDLVLRLDLEASGDAVVPANRHLLSQAIANLVDNAIKYTPTATRRAPADVVVSVRRIDGAIEVVVADAGPGIAAEDRERALKRFVRLEASRSLPGTGLGLSLAVAVARLHHGKVTLEDNAPGLRAVLTLPAA